MAELDSLETLALAPREASRQYGGGCGGACVIVATATLVVIPDEQAKPVGLCVDEGHQGACGG